MLSRRDIVLLSGVLLLLASPGRSLTLDTLVSGGSFSTGNGLFFHDFSVQITGDLAGVLTASDLSILPLADGFRMDGPISAADGELGEISLSYRVDADPQGLPISGASLLSTVAASGVGAQATVDELLLAISSGDSIAYLSVFDTGGLPGAPDVFDQATFEPVFGIDVEKGILVDSVLLGGGGGGSARIPLVEQRYQVVPEPTTLVLMSLGLVGLAMAGGRGRTRS